MDYRPVGDHELAGRAAAGDAAAFELLVLRHQQGAWRFAVATLGSPEDAEEAVQEAFLKAFRGLAGFRAESSFRTWLLTIVRRACLDVLRRRTNVVPLEQAGRLRQPEDHVDDRRAIEEALLELPREERAAFVLVDVLGCSRLEAARTESVPASTLKSRLYRARERMARALSEPDEMRGERR